MERYSALERRGSRHLLQHGGAARPLWSVKRPDAQDGRRAVPLDGSRRVACTAAGGRAVAGGRGDGGTAVSLWVSVLHDEEFCGRWRWWLHNSVNVL